MESQIDKKMGNETETKMIYGASMEYAGRRRLYLQLVEAGILSLRQPLLP